MVAPQARHKPWQPGSPGLPLRSEACVHLALLTHRQAAIHVDQDGNITLGALRSIESSTNRPALSLVFAVEAALWSASACIGAFIPVADVIWEVEEGGFGRSLPSGWR